MALTRLTMFLFRRDKVSKKSSGSRACVSFCNLLFLLFLGLKLTGHIDWSWWWVTAPLWIPMSLMIFALALCSVVIGFIKILEESGQ